MTEEKKTEQQGVGVEIKEQQAQAAVKDKPQPELSGQAKELLKTIEKMSVLELSTLVHALEDKFGVSASMPVVAAGAAPGAGGGAQQEEKSTFTVELSKVGANKIQVIKEIRTITSLGLKEAKELVDSAPKPIKQDVGKEEAEEIKKKLTAVGATVELK